MDLDQPGFSSVEEKIINFDGCANIYQCITVKHVFKYMEIKKWLTVVVFNHVDDDNYRH